MEAWQKAYDAGYLKWWNQSAAVKKMHQNFSFTKATFSTSILSYTTDTWLDNTENHLTAAWKLLGFFPSTAKSPRKLTQMPTCRFRHRMTTTKSTAHVVELWDTKLVNWSGKVNSSPGLLVLISSSASRDKKAIILWKYLSRQKLDIESCEAVYSYLLVVLCEQLEWSHTVESASVNSQQLDKSHGISMTNCSAYCL